MYPPLHILHYLHVLLVLWVIVTLISGVDNSSLSLSSGRDSHSVVNIARPIDYHRLEKSQEEEPTQLPIGLTEEKVEQAWNIDSDEKLIVSKENINGFESEKHTKTKPSHKQLKYLTNDFKNNSLTKVKLETGFAAASNESFNEKHKLGILKYTNLNKKDIKLNANHTDNTIKSNLSFTNQDNLGELKPKVNSGDNEPVYVAGINVTQEMNDQPVEVPSEIALNTTELIDDDSLLQNSSIHNASHSSTSEGSRTMPAFDSFDIIIVCVIVLGTVLLLGLIGGGGYVVYRRKIWNMPQTFSDKCSNADSSGYIDDSTLRENSEEMYSLDNDSFLNSLEAMTIQNYWTDNVKHTKL